MTDVSSGAIRCYEANPGTAAKTYTVNASGTVGFTAASSISHPGPLQFYLAKVPTGQTAETFDGRGDVWFKIYSQGATFSGGQMSWDSSGTFHDSYNYFRQLHCKYRTPTNPIPRQNAGHRPTPQGPPLRRLPPPRRTHCSAQGLGLRRRPILPRVRTAQSCKWRQWIARPARRLPRCV